MEYIQVILITFLLFALSRVVLRFYGGQIERKELVFWSLIFCASIIAVLFPEISSRVANFLGIGRGADLIIYGSIVLLFYLMFRAYVYIENLRHEITELVRILALKKRR